MRRSHTQSVTKEEADTVNARSWIEKHPNVAKALIGAGAALAAGALAYGAYKAAPYAEYAYGELVTGANELKQLAEQREAILHTYEPPEVTVDTELQRAANKYAAELIHPEQLAQKSQGFQENLDDFLEAITLKPGAVPTSTYPMPYNLRQKQHEYMTQHAPDVNPYIRDVLFAPPTNRPPYIPPEHRAPMLPDPIPTEPLEKTYPYLRRHMKKQGTIDSPYRNKAREDQIFNMAHSIGKGSTNEDTLRIRRVHEKLVQATADEYLGQLKDPNYKNPNVPKIKAELKAIFDKGSKLPG